MGKESLFSNGIIIGSLLSKNISAQLKLRRRSLKSMRSKQYQTLYIDGLYAEDCDFEEKGVYRGRNSIPLGSH